MNLVELNLQGLKKKEKKMRRRLPLDEDAEEEAAAANEVKTTREKVKLSAKAEDFIPAQFWITAAPVWVVGFAVFDEWDRGQTKRKWRRR